MNVTTLVFLGLAVVWAIVLLPEVVRKVAGGRHSDTIRSFNHQLSVLDRSGGREASAPNVIDLRTRNTTPATARVFLVLHLIADVLLVTYLVLLNQANQAGHAAAARQARPAWERGQDDLRTATVGRATPAPRRVAN